MKYKLFTFDIMSTSQIEDVNKFLTTHRIISIDKQLVKFDTNAVFTFLIQYEEPSNTSSNIVYSKNENNVDYKEILSAEDFAIFSQLRDIRNKIADDSGVKRFNVFTNEDLANIVMKKAVSKSQLLSISGIGEKKVEKYSGPILEFTTKVFSNEANRESLQQNL